MRNGFTLVVLSLWLASCTWVKLTPEAEKVVLLEASEVVNCRHLGKTTVSVKADIVTISRDVEKVKVELATLARNSAVSLQGDAVVPASEIEKGQQVFDVYRCRR